MEGKNNTYRKYTFPKSERLSSKKIIDALFTEGASFYFYPFSIRLLPITNQATSHQFMVSVSKRNFKRAVDRNRIKRLVREAYRLNKYKIEESNIGSHCFAIAYIYTAKEIHPYGFIESKLTASIERLKNEMGKFLAVNK